MMVVMVVMMIMMMTFCGRFMYLFTQDNVVPGVATAETCARLQFVLASRPVLFAVARPSHGAWVE